MIDIVLISPSNEKLGGFHSFVPRSVPLASGILAGYLLKFNFNPEIIDEEIAKIDKKSLINKIKKMANPKVFGISCMTTNAQKTYNIAKLIKEIDETAIVIAGGIHPTVAAEEVLKSGYIDFVIREEGERAILSLLQKIKAGDKDFSNVRNLTYIDKEGNIQFNESEKEPFDVNEQPMFPYHLFDKKHYDFGFILTSRGCPFNCIFCSQRAITKGKYRPRDNKLVIKELKHLIENEKQKNITFFDDFFTGDKKRVRELCQMIRDEGLHKKSSFGVQTRGDSIDREILEEMKKSGFDSLMFGFESASDHLMKLIKKRESVESIVNAIKMAKEIGFAVEATFIFGFPEEKYEDRIKSLQVAKSVGLDRARFNIATPYPGTEFYNMALAENKLRKIGIWNNFSSASAVAAGLFEKYTVPYCPDGTKPYDLAGEVFLANLLFYMNFDSLKKLVNVKKSGSGKWFEIPEKKLFDPKTWFMLAELGVTVSLKTLSYLIFSSECRRFFMQGFFSNNEVKTIAPECSCEAQMPVMNNQSQNDFQNVQQTVINQESEKLILK